MADQGVHERKLATRREDPPGGFYNLQHRSIGIAAQGFCNLHSRSIGVAKYRTVDSKKLEYVSGTI